MEAKETHEAFTVVDLEFSLVIAEVVDALQDENLEPKQAVIRRVPACHFRFLAKGFIQHGAEDFPLDDAVEADK